MHRNYKSLFDTRYADISGMESSLSKVIKFLLDNRSLVLSEETMNDVFSNKARTRIQTPMASIYDGIVGTSVKEIFTGIYPNTGRNVVSVPDLLTLSSITLDLAAIKQASVLSGYSEYKDKIILDLGRLLRNVSVSSTTVSDIHELQSLVVRGALCRSFLQLKSGRGWLSPTLSKFIIESYSMTVSSQLSRIYSLNYAEQLNVATYLALFISKEIYNGYSVTPPTFFLCDFLGDKKTLQSITDSAEDHLREGLTLSKTCELIAMNGPERMRAFDIGLLHRACANFGSDNISNMVALEYPPYWVHQILLALSGGKSSILYSLKTYRLLERAKTFAKDLSITPSFLSELES